MSNPIEGKRILLGVTGSIACYKAADLASKLTQSGALGGCDPDPGGDPVPQHR